MSSSVGRTNRANFCTPTTLAFAPTLLNRKSIELDGAMERAVARLFLSGGNGRLGWVLANWIGIPNHFVCAVAEGRLDLPLCRNRSRPNRSQVFRSASFDSDPSLPATRLAGC